jgi:GT2 family glycosyltransferase
MKAVVITVNYKSADSALAFLASLEGTQAFSEIEVIMVDNSPGEDLSHLRRAISLLDNSELLESSGNRGYFGAARFALDHYLAHRHVLPDWVIVCNHDVIIEDNDFFSKLFRENPETVGVMGPRIQALPGRVDQNPFMRRRPSWLRWANLRFISSNYGAATLWDWLGRRKAEFRSWLATRRTDTFTDGSEKRESIYAAHGSFFIFSRRYFEAGGFLDGNLFLYGEEISVAEICRSLGLPVVYEPSLRVLHREHQSTGKALSRFTYECQKKALQYVTSRYLSGSRDSAGSRQPDLP